METAECEVTQPRWRVQRRVASILLYVFGSAAIVVMGVIPFLFFLDALSSGDFAGMYVFLMLLVLCEAIPMMLMLAGVWFSQWEHGRAVDFWIAIIALILSILIADMMNDSVNGYFSPR